MDGTDEAPGSGPDPSADAAPGAARTRRPRPEPPPPAPPSWLLPSLIGVLGAALVIIVLGFIVGGDHPDDAAARTRRAAAPLPELPRGGRVLLPGHRVVSFAGAPQDPELGALGVGSLRDAARHLQRQARPYARKTRPTQPAMQLVATIAHAAPGRDRRYNLHQSNRTIARYLREARRIRALLVLDIQPGRSTFVSETRRLERWLREPDVAIAYDPEWRMRNPGEVPGQIIGSVDASEMQRSLDEVARIVREHRLPRKLVIVHRFTPNMVRDLSRIRVPAEVQAVMSIDGVGDRPNKVAKYRQLTRDLPRAWRPAFKVFYKEDRKAGGLMTPAQVMRLRPRPDVVLYE